MRVAVAMRRVMRRDAVAMRRDADTCRDAVTVACRRVACVRVRLRCASRATSRLCVAILCRVAVCRVRCCRDTCRVASRCVAMLVAMLSRRVAVASLAVASPMRSCFLCVRVASRYFASRRVAGRDACRVTSRKCRHRRDKCDSVASRLSRRVASRDAVTTCGRVLCAASSGCLVTVPSRCCLSRYLSCHLSPSPVCLSVCHVAYCRGHCLSLS
jgi:hypothetical protein